MRTESKNTYDQAESAILEFVDGPKDSRFMMAAKTIARDRLLGRLSTPLTLNNVQKVTRYRGQEELETMVQRFMALQTTDVDAPSEEESPETAEFAQKESDAARSIAADINPAPTTPVPAGQSRWPWGRSAPKDPKR